MIFAMLVWLTEALSSRSSGKVKLIIPAKGELKKLILHAQDNAKEALARNRATQTTQLSLLKRVAQIFTLPKIPERIEVFDNSHIQGTNAVGAMIVAGLNGFDKNSYRKFNIQDALIKDPNPQVAENLKVKAAQRAKAGGDDIT